MLLTPLLPPWLLLPLQEINPLPFIFMVANGMGWLAYGLYIHDFFVFCSNIAAVLLGLFYVMTCSKYCKEQVSLWGFALGEQAAGGLP